MEYNITLSENGKYIVITVKGGMARTSALKMNLDAHAMGRKLGIRRYLMDCTNSTHTDSVVNDYQFVYNDMLPEALIDRFARSALWVKPGDHSHDFVVTVSRNAGLKVSIFHDLESALKYLMQD